MSLLILFKGGGATQNLVGRSRGRSRVRGTLLTGPVQVVSARAAGRTRVRGALTVEAGDTETKVTQVLLEADVRDGTVDVRVTQVILEVDAPFERAGWGIVLPA